MVKNVVSEDFARDEDEMEDESEADAKALSNVDISALLTDWKHSRVSSPSSDLAFFFLSSTSQAMREKYTQDWLEQYYFSFTECLRSKFGIKLANVYPEFDFDVFCKDFKKHVYRAYLQVPKNIGFIKLKTPSIMNFRLCKCSPENYVLSKMNSIT